MRARPPRPPMRQTTDGLAEQCRLAWLAFFLEPTLWGWHTFGTNCKNLPKITFEKFVKLSGHTCVCNNLTSFECEVYKNRKRKLLWKNWWNHIKWTYFWRILPIWNHSASPSLPLACLPTPSRRLYTSILRWANVATKTKTRFMKKKCLKAILSVTRSTYICSRCTQILHTTPVLHVMWSWII